MKIRSFILAVVGASALSLIVLFFWALSKHRERASRIGHCPEFAVQCTDGSQFRPTSSNSSPLVLMFFSPDCEFCQKEIEGIIANVREFQGVRWLFVTISEVDDFLIDYPIDAIPNASICIDVDGSLMRTFDVTAPPAIFVYDEMGALIGFRRGAVPINTILQWLN